ncbi:MAG TPA: phosphotransacetylase family protein [Humidesulfovibrio sp.]|uniref:phosphotransacetylase family protein n=1 Tax=Humidesulfovibrio sp. TaxID=2910988 RepID=UPI002C8433C8|nr:phosphotransacetylase family protein [Humidesulfovibrio sp.]HWR04586.1 phosphotransacetylase family protein [Humidesulfovibrio sp.]
MAVGVYIGSTTGYSGKNLIAMSLGLRFKKLGLKVGYMKPVGAVPRKEDGKPGDEDAMFLQEVLGLRQDPSLVTPVVVNRDFTRRAFSEDIGDLMPGIVEAYGKLAEGKDVMIIAGSGNFLGSGTYCGLDGVSVSRALGAKTVVIDRYSNELKYDYLLRCREALGDDLAGVILNDIPEHYRPEVDELLVPFFRRKGVDVLGVIASDPIMSAIKVSDLAERLGGKVISAHHKADRVVENFLIGTMQVENFLAHFMRHKNSAIIVGGDRSDVQLVALEGSCPCLILTGNLHPNDIILTRSEVLQTPIIMVREDTFAVAKKMENILSRHKLRDMIKVNHGVRLVADALDFDLLRQRLGME